MEELYFSILFFVYGTIFGSFYNVVGDRLPAGKSIISPGSHCPKCKHRLTILELIPIFSYILQGGRCKNCKSKIPVFHLIYEIISGLLFVFCYLKFGFNLSIIIPLTLVSMLLIIVVSDIEYMVISDEVLIVFGLILFTEMLLINGGTFLVESIVNGIISFIIMFGIKICGDFIFKKESMGGGDIKLLFFFGLCLGWENSLLSIFLGSIVGLPISLIVLSTKRTNIIPFGPFLSIGALIILLTGFDLNALMSVLLV